MTTAVPVAIIVSRVSEIKGGGRENKLQYRYCNFLLGRQRLKKNKYAGRVVDRLTLARCHIKKI